MKKIMVITGIAALIAILGSYFARCRKKRRFSANVANDI